MPNKTQQMISGLLEAYKRKRRWKVLTIILSVVVLCNTFYAMQNAAVAVTDQTAEEALVDPANVNAPASVDPMTIPVNASGDPTIEDLLSQTPADPAAADPAAQDPAAQDPSTQTPPVQDPALQDPALQDPAIMDPAAQGSQPGTLSGGTITDEIIETTGEDALTTGGETDPSGTAVLGQTRQSRGATTRAANVPENITSAIPVSLSVTDENNRLVNTVRTGDTLYVDLAWQIEDASEIDATDDYFYIRLPEGMTYPAGPLYFTLDEIINTTDGYLEPGVWVAIVDFMQFAADTRLPDGTYLSAGQYARITHRESAVWLNNDGYLTPDLYLQEGRTWQELSIPATVSATGDDSPLLPSIVVNGRTVYNDQGNGYNGYLELEEDTADRITNIRLGTYKINGYTNGVTSGSGSRANYVEVGKEEEIMLELPWVWSTPQGLTDGDYFEIRLPETLVYDEYGPRALFDSDGNLVTDEVYYDDATGRYIYRFTYAQVTRSDYIGADGTMSVRGYVKDPDTLWYDYDGKARITLTVSVIGSYASKTGYATVKEQATTIDLPNGEWILRRGSNRTYDYEASHIIETLSYGRRSWRGMQKDWMDSVATLFVLTAHTSSLSNNPFTNVKTVEFSPGPANYATNNNPNPGTGGTNYIVAYCASADRLEPNSDGDYNYNSGYGYGYGYGYGTENKRSKYKLYDLSAVGFNSDVQQKLTNIMSNAYPYVTLDEMYERLELDNVVSRYSWNANLATTAVNYAIWKVTTPNNVRLGYTSTDQTVAAIANKLIETEAPQNGANYQIDGTPTITFNGQNATVTGRIRPTAGANSLNGTFSTASGKSTSVNIDRYGNFSATLRNVSRADQFHLHFEGTTNSVRVLYFGLTNSYYSQYGWEYREQDLIAAEVGSTPFCFDYDFPSQGETSRKVRVIKRWTDENGNVLTSLPTADVTLSLYRRVRGGQREWVRDITLTSRNGYQWESELELADANGNVYTYSVVEKTIPEGYIFLGFETTYADNGRTVVLTATNREKEEETTRVRVEKKWDNVGDENTHEWEAVVQLFARIDGVEVPVYIDKNIYVENNGYVVENGIRTTKGNYFFEGGNGRREVIVYLSNEEGNQYIFDKLPKVKDGKEIVYVIRETAAGKLHSSNRWRVEQKNGALYAGSFEVVYEKGPAADMGEEFPSVVITNRLPDTKITVVKEWPEAGIPANIKIVSAHVILYRVTEVNGQQELQEVYVKVKETKKSATGDIVIGSDYKFGTKPGADYGVAAWTLTKDNGWKVSFEGLPVYEEDGSTRIRYVFKEDEYTVIENGTPHTYKTDGTEHLFTVTHGDVQTTPDGLTQAIKNSYDYTNVIVTKTWEGLSEAQKQNYRVVVGLFKLNPSGRGGLGTKWPVRIESAGKTETLTQTGLVISGNYFILDQSPAGYEEVRAELTADNNWAVHFENLPRYEADGKTPVQYLIRELAVYDKDGNEVTGSFNIRYAQYTQVMGDGQTYAWATEDQESGGDACVDITNTITSGTITVEKKWLNYDGTGWFWAKPAYIEVKLTAKRKGAEIPDGTDVLKGVTQVVQLMENNGWSHTWKDILEDKDVTYFIEEVTVVYVKNGQEIRIPADEYTGFIGPDGPVEVKKKAGGGFEITGLENRREVTELIIIKEDETTRARLNGAEFALYLVDKETGAEEYIATFKTGTDTSLPAGYQEGVVRVDGKDHEGLLFGYYYKLVETKAPAGYQEPENNNAPYIIFTMNGNGTPYDPTDDWIEVLDRNKNNDAVFETANDKTLGIRWLRVENRPRGYVLPEAGGIGTKAYTTGGISLMIATLLMYSTWKFMRKNEKGGRKN